jgi:hypothetical protein
VQAHQPATKSVIALGLTSCLGYHQEELLGHTASFRAWGWPGWETVSVMTGAALVQHRQQSRWARIG